LSGNQIQVTGRITFEAHAVPFTGATAYVSLLDVSRQDAPSKTIVKHTIPNVNYEVGKKIEFSLTGTINDMRGTYIVDVHVDVDGDGRVSIGDYITMGYYTISPQEKQIDVGEVLVKRVS
jgi:uncharacterized lipoprotein YbaY